MTGTLPDDDASAPNIESDAAPSALVARLRILLHPLTLVSLVFICTLAFLCRLMSVIRYEVVIHEFDPYFQYKSTLELAGSGSDAFQSWFDAGTWYPLSRSMPISLYPGLMYTAVFFVRLSEYLLHIPISVLQACVFMGPVMSVVGTLFSFDIGCMIDDSDSTKVMTGLLSALFFSIIPGFIQRSVAGSYDNESNSITAMVIAFDLWLRATGSSDKSLVHRSSELHACRTAGGKVFYAYARDVRLDVITPVLAALAYFYMAVSWGGFVFLTLLIPFHIFICLVFGYLTPQAELAFQIWETVGLLCMGLVFREHGSTFTHVIFLPGIGVHGLLTTRAVWQNLTARGRLTPRSIALVRRYLVVGVLLFVALLVPILIKLGLLGFLGGRLLSFVNPTYARKHNPIVASVAEHQPTIWTAFYFNVWFLIMSIPVGLYYCICKNPRLSTLFLAVYIATTIWFSAVMSRMILFASPAIAVCAAYTISKIMESIVTIDTGADANAEVAASAGAGAGAGASVKASVRASAKKLGASVVALVLVVLFILSFIRHALFCAKEVYSSPSIVLLGRGQNGQPTYIDDFREAYAWLEHNTHATAKVASWWDYGYQINQVGNKTVVVDNLTRNDFWIGLVGAILASDEATAWRLCKELNIDYMLVVFGGASGYDADDIGKFLWPIRISGNRHFDRTYSWIAPIVEGRYYSHSGEYRIDARGSHTMRNSLMYKMCYHHLEEVSASGHDAVRRSQPDKSYYNKLDNFEEVYSSERLIVRIYKVKDALNF